MAINKLFGKMETKGLNINIWVLVRVKTGVLKAHKQVLTHHRTFFDAWWCGYKDIIKCLLGTKIPL